MVKPAKPEQTRAAFNRAAKEARVTDNLPALNALAVSLTTGRPVTKGHWTEELRQTLATAATQAAADWWNDGGNCHKKISAAIKSAARDFRGAGGYRADNVWRGGYSTDQRKFGSQLFDHAAAVRLHDAMGEGTEPAEEEPSALKDTEADARDLRDAQLAERAATTRERELEQKAGEEGSAVIAAGAGVLEAGAERTSHDGGHADDERLDPRDDGERGYGVDGATRGLWTGTVIPSPYWIAEQLAHAEESGADQAYLAAIDAAGSLANWINKDGNRKCVRAAHESRYAAIRRRVRQRAAGMILAVGSDAGLQAAWLAAMPAGTGYRTVDPKEKGGEFTREPVMPPPPSGQGVEPWDGVVSAAWPKDAPTGAKGRHFKPVTVWSGYWDVVTVSGHEWADHVCNVRQWKRSHQTGPALSLLDLAGDGVSMRAIRARPVVEWGRIVRFHGIEVSMVDV